MNSQNLARATFVLSRTAYEDLAYLSRRMGASRSALVREVLEGPVGEMATLLRSVPDVPNEEQLDLFRAEARKLVAGYVASVDEEMGE